MREREREREGGGGNTDVFDEHLLDQFMSESRLIEVFERD